MLYAAVSAGGAACADSWVAACGAQGPWLLRAAGDEALKIEAPSTGFALYKGKIIDCPEAIVPIATVGGALEANGAFPGGCWAGGGAGHGAAPRRGCQACMPCPAVFQALQDLP